MSDDFPYLILVSFYFLVIFLAAVIGRKNKSTDDKSQQNSVNTKSEKTQNIFTQDENPKGTDKTHKSGLNCFEFNTLYGVGSVTQVGSEFEWEIKHFSSNCKKVGEFVSSPIFVTTWLNNYIIGWMIRLYPKGMDIFSENYLSIYIECFATEKVIGNIKFSILNDRNCKRWGWWMNETTFDKQKYILGNPTFVRRHLIMDRNNRVLLNDTLKISCEVILHPKQNENVYGEHPSKNLFYYKLEPLSDFEKLLETGVGSDVTFHVDGIEIKAHKAFLISRSPVFQAMFEHEMKEKAENIVEILDIKNHILKELLRFMYTGKVNNIKTNASELLIASEKYCIQRLKVLCEYELSRHIQLKNVFQLLELAVTYNANFLKLQTILFIGTCRHEIVEIPELKKLADLHADTVCEIFRAFVKSR